MKINKKELQEALTTISGSDYTIGHKKDEKD